ncbi:DUF3990 domain-containing protein [Vibrio quintilis]|uniref:DUF3990 domain-containing protein n=1 Tax=Vibrio quintilis TaxID=1117707 RepID=UPI00190EA9F1|nr:DUF3990 domain-containing protein [Vibrio quintilis]
MGNPVGFVDPLGLVLESHDHGDDVTTFYHAGDIQGPIDPSKGRNNLDFNPAGKGGFYVTKDPEQAADWARKRKHPTITQFDIPNSELDKLNMKVFDSADSEWADFVTKGRNKGLTHSYDAVSGPMVANPGPVRAGKSPISIGSQTAIFSKKAAALFDKYKINGS